MTTRDSQDFTTAGLCSSGGKPFKTHEKPLETTFRITGTQLSVRCTPGAQRHRLSKYSAAKLDIRLCLGRQPSPSRRDSAARIVKGCSPMGRHLTASPKPSHYIAIIKLEKAPHPGPTCLESQSGKGRHVLKLVRGSAPTRCLQSARCCPSTPRHAPALPEPDVSSGETAELQLKATTRSVAVTSDLALGEGDRSRPKK